MASSFETQRFAMLLTMRAEAGAFHGEAETMLAILMVRRRDRAVSNHEAPMRPSFETHRLAMLLEMKSRILI
jgi:hypothetical protein